MIRFLLILAASFTLAACGDRPASSGTTAPPAASAVDTAIKEATRTLLLAEIGYEPLATAALKLIETGAVKGTTAATIRDLNRTVASAFKAGKSAQSAATIYAELAKAKAASTSLSAIVQAFK